MRVLLLTSFITLASATAYANPQLPLINANCESLQLSMGTSIATELKVVPFWKNPAVFPNPPTEGSAGKDGQPYRIECPLLSVSDDGNVIEIKANSYKQLLEFIPKYASELNFYGESGYRYPNIREGFYFNGYSYDIHENKFKASIYELKEGSDLSKNTSLIFDVPSKLVLGYKVDGGPIKPLIYDRKVSRYKSDFRNANVIDIYQKLDKPMVMERLTIDKQNGLIRMYRSSEFPSS